MYTRNATYEGLRVEKWLENEFIKRSIIPSRPVGDIGRYDFILDNRVNPLIKIQVKKLNYMVNYDNYHVKIANYKKNNKGVVVPIKHYTSDMIDMFVLVGMSGEREKNTLTENCVYFIPIEVVGDYKAITVCPTRSIKRKSLAAVLEKYKDAWHLVDGSRDYAIRKDSAVI